MDDVRLVTSHIHPGESITPEDEEKLLRIYLRLEQYLLTKETVRVFTQDSLRQDIAQKLRLTSDTSNTFWHKLSNAPAPPAIAPQPPLQPQAPAPAQ